VLRNNSIRTQCNNVTSATNRRMVFLRRTVCRSPWKSTLVVIIFEVIATTSKAADSGMEARRMLRQRRSRTPKPVLIVVAWATEDGEFTGLLYEGCKGL